jgi:DNA-binding protein Fis
MTLYLAAAAPILFGDRLPDPGLYVPGTRHRKDRIAFYGRLQQATASIATAPGAEFAVQKLARTFGAPVVLRANDGRQVAASPAHQNPLASLPAALLPQCRHFLLRQDGDVAPTLRRAMTHYGVDAILPLYPYGDGATGWLLIGAPFASLVVSPRDVRETTPLFDRVGELVLEQLVAMHKEAEQHEQRAVELNQARQRLEAENESLRRENARLLREHPADAFSLISTASQGVVTPPTVTLLSRNKDLLRTLRPFFPQIAHYVSPASDGFRKQRLPEVLICHIPSPEDRRDKQIVRLIQGDENNTVFLLYGDGARALLERHHKTMLGHIVAHLPRSLAGKAIGGWIHTIAEMRRAILDTGTADCPLMGRSQVFIDLIADAIRASRFLEPVLIRGAGANEILALARFIHNKSGTGKMSVFQARPPLRPRSGGGRQGRNEEALDEAIRLARGGTLVIEDLARIPPAELNGLIKGVLDLGDIRLIAGLVLRDDAAEPPLPASLKIFNLEIPPLHERRLDLPLLTLYYEVLYNLQAAADSYLNPLEIESMLETHQVDTQVALKALVFEQLEDRSTGARRTVYPEPDGTRKSLDECVADFEAELIRRTLEQCGGNKSKTARLLGLRPNTLHYKMVRHGLAGNRRKLDD